MTRGFLYIFWSYCQTSQNSRRQYSVHPNLSPRMLSSQFYIYFASEATKILEDPEKFFTYYRMSKKNLLMNSYTKLGLRYINSCLLLAFI